MKKISIITKRVNGSSRYRGVSWHKQHQKWQARIRYKRKSFYLGLFNHEEDAARAYNRKAHEFNTQFGIFSYNEVNPLF